MMQNNVSSPSSVPKPLLDHNYQNPQALSLNSKSSRQAALYNMLARLSEVSVISNPPTKQNCLVMTDGPDVQFQPNVWNNFSESYSQHVPFNGPNSISDCRRDFGQTEYNFNTNYYQGQQLRHQHIPQKPVYQTPLQMLEQLAVPFPFNTFTPYGPPFIKHGTTGTSTGETQCPFSQPPPNHFPSMQNCFPPTYNVPPPVISQASQRPAFVVTEPQTVRRNKKSARTNSQAPSAISTLASFSSASRFNPQVSAFQKYKKRQLSNSHDEDTSPPSSQQLAKSNDGKDEIASSSTVNDDQQSDGHKMSDPYSDNFTCVACLKGSKDTVLLPCRHLCVCQNCSSSILLCPICNNVFSETMTVFI